MKMMKLNNKGFTLVELLAVVVILAVVMGIAANSVLSSMNNSRKGSLQNSAKSVSQSFQTKYSEAMVTQSMGSVYGDVMAMGYNFSVATPTKPVFYYLSEELKDELNLSPSTYMLGTSGENNEGLNINADGASVSVDKSFVAFNGKNVVVCLIANDTGSYYVADFSGSNISTTILNKTVNFAGENKMWSCSLDNVNSWTVSANVGAGNVVTPPDDET